MPEHAFLCFLSLLWRTLFSDFIPLHLISSHREDCANEVPLHILMMQHYASYRDAECKTDYTSCARQGVRQDSLASLASS